MIPVRRIFLRVNELSRKDRGGYVDVENFNRNLNDVQDVLLNYYFKMYETSKEVSDAISPFVVSTVLNVRGGRVAKPSNYRNCLSIRDTKAVLVGRITRWEDGHDFEQMNVDETSWTLDSPIRKPSSNHRTWRYEMRDDVFLLHPKSFEKVKLVYLKNPPDAIYAVRVNPNLDEPIYDPDNSVDLIWSESEEQNILDLMLYFRGIETRDSELIQFANINNISNQKIA